MTIDDVIDIIKRDPFCPPDADAADIHKWANEFLAYYHNGVVPSADHPLMGSDGWMRDWSSCRHEPTPLFTSVICKRCGKDLPQTEKRA